MLQLECADYYSIKMHKNYIVWCCQTMKIVSD